MNKKLIAVLLLLSLTSCNKEIDVPLDIANEAILIHEYVEDIREVYDDEYFVYTFLPAYGNFNIDGDDHYIIKMYFADSSIEFICWHKDDDIDWEVLKDG